MRRINRWAFNIVPPVRLVGACVLAGFIGVAIAFLAAVVTGRTATSEAAFQPAGPEVAFQAPAPPMVTVDRRRDRLDQRARKVAKADFLADVVVPLDRSQRRLKAMPTLPTHIAEPVNIEAAVREAPVRSLAGDVGAGPIALISPTIEAAMSEGPKRTRSARTQRQSRDPARTAAGAAGNVSGFAGRTTGALGL